MFEALSDKIRAVMGKVERKGRLSIDDIDNVLSEIKVALIEADVNIKVVREFIEELRLDLVGKEITKGLKPYEEVLKRVYEKLVDYLGGSATDINFSPVPPTVIMMVGLQGSGKTTTCAKLANYLKKNGRHPVLVACDTYRPAAIDQLRVLASSVGCDFYYREGALPVDIAIDGLRYAKEKGRDVVIIDTAGRLHVDEFMMQELVNIRDRVKPSEILLVVDAMTGQEAANVAKTFVDKVGLTGVILTKLDGDARGGSALSVKKVANVPIKFVGVGEKIDQFERFYPDRIASRIIGMGDILTLVEKARSAVSEDKIRSIEERILSGEFTLEDFREQLAMIRKMGSLGGIIDMIPGLSSYKNLLQGSGFNDKEIVHMEAVINSMTKEERANPNIIDSSRKRRIARGSGTSVEMVNRVIKQYMRMKKTMKELKKDKKKLKEMERMMKLANLSGGMGKILKMFR